MKVCLLCDNKIIDKKVNLLQQNYEKNHEVDANNFFCKNLFKKERGIFIPNKCARCEYFHTNSRDKKTIF